MTFESRRAPSILNLGIQINALSISNKKNLIDVLTAAEPVMAEIAKVKPSAWKNIGTLVKDLKESFGTRLKSGVISIGQGALTPLRMQRNKFSNFIDQFLSPLKRDINNIKNEIEAFALRNQEGAAIGGIIGLGLGAFLGIPQLGALFGSLTGSTIQNAIGGGELQLFDFLLGVPFGLFRLLQTAIGGSDQGPATQFAASGGGALLEPPRETFVADPRLRGTISSSLLTTPRRNRVQMGGFAEFG